jgi:HK97 family phage prohead protease
MRDLELRNHSGAVELRAGGKGSVLAGYASVFNKLSQNLGGFVERVDPAAFNKSLADGVPVVGRFNHEDNYLLGTTEGGTLRLLVDGTGLHYEIDLPDTSAGRDVKVLAERGDLTRSSFAFRTLDDEWDLTPEGFPLRTLLSVQLVDVAPVVNPAYRDTTTGLRSFAAAFGVPLEEVQAEARANNLRALLEKQSEKKGSESSRAHGNGDPGKGGQDEIHPLLTERLRRLQRL